LDNWNKIEFIFCHKLHVSPIDLQKLEFYRIQYILKEFEEYIDKENKEYEKQKRDADRQSKIKPPSFGGFQMPKFDPPKFDMPKY
jgi:hypothetical protein